MKQVKIYIEVLEGVAMNQHHETSISLALYPIGTNFNLSQYAYVDFYEKLSLDFVQQYSGLLFNKILIIKDKTTTISDVVIDYLRQRLRGYLDTPYPLRVLELTDNKWRHVSYYE